MTVAVKALVEQQMRDDDEMALIVYTAPNRFEVILFSNE